MDTKEENEGTIRTVAGPRGSSNAQSQLPDWYIRYLVFLCERDENLEECYGF